MSRYLYDGQPWQGGGEKIEIKTLKKEFGSNKEKKKKRDQVKKNKISKRDRNSRESTTVCYSKLTLDRSL